MKKKLFLFVVVLVAAAILISGCSTDSLKERAPGVKANVNMLLADDIDENVGEIETEQELDSVNFGADLVTEVGSQLEEVSNSSDELDIPDISIPGASGTIERTESVNFEDANSLKSALESINFESGKLVVNFGDSKGVKLLNVNEMRSNDGESVDLAEERLDLSKSLEITFEVNLEQFNSDTMSLKVGFESPVVRSVEASFDNLTDLGESNDFDTSIEASTVIDNYDRPDELDSIDENKTKLHLNFDLPQGVIMDFAPVSGNDIKFLAEGSNGEFALKDSIDGETFIKGNSNNSASIELFSKLYSLLNNPDTTLVKINGGDFDLSSDNSVVINRDTKIGMKSITLSEFALDHKGIQVEPQSVETLDNEEIEDIKKGLENIKLVIAGINNQLEAEISIVPYLAGLTDFSNELPSDMDSSRLEELKTALYNEDNKLIDPFTIKANTSNAEEEIIIGHDEMDRFTAEDLFFGVVVKVPELNIEDAENASFAIKEVIAELNINLDTDDFE